MNDNRKKLLIILLISVLIFSLFTLYISSETPFSVSARSAALYVPETDSFLYLKNPDEKRGMASTTKIMTALIALEQIREDELITVGDESCGIDGSSLYLKSGQTLSAIDLIYALMLQSANDAASALAYHISGGIEEFALLMNTKAEELGMTNTHFKNPHGLDDKEHFTTARDLAILSANALKNSRLREISSTQKREISISGSSHILVNHNKMLRMYEGCIGLKTGYTKKCGRCLVSAADKNDIEVISVTLDAPDDWRDHKMLLNSAYELLERRILCEKGDFSYSIPIINKNDFVKISAKDHLSLIVEKNSSEIIPNVRLSQYYSAPIYKNEILGTVIFTQNGNEVARVSLVSESNIEKRQSKKRSFSLFN